MANQQTAPRSAADVVYDAVHCAAIGGSVVALFFLLLDVLQGHALFTPSLMGSVLFGGMAAGAVHEVHLDMVAYYTIVHFAAFGVLGGAIAYLVHEVELHAKHPVVVLAVIFALFEVAFFAGATWGMPGVIERLGAGWIALANALAAGAIALFLLATHRADLWLRLKHAAHLA